MCLCVQISFFTLHLYRHNIPNEYFKNLKNIKSFIIYKVIGSFLFTFAPKIQNNKRIMQKNLVIVESPAKAKTIEKFLGDDFKVMSSYGHIRDLKKKELSVDIDTLQPDYEIPEEKVKVVKELKANAKQAEKVWLASDEQPTSSLT